MTIRTYIALGLVIASALILIWLIFIIIHKRNQTKKELNSTFNSIPKNILIFTTFLFLIITGISFMTLNIAINKGLYSDQITIQTVFDNVFEAMDDQSKQLPNNPKNLICIMYRFDCSTCTELDPKLKVWAETQDQPYLFISTRSENGASLTSEYKIDEVPSILAFNNKGTAKFFRVYNSDNNTLDTEELSNVERYLKEDRTIL